MITNKYNLPQKIVDILLEDRYEKTPHRYSVTEIINSTAEVILKRRYPDYYIPDASEFIPRLFGTAFHSLFDDGSEFAEQKLEVKIDDVTTLVGKIDRLENDIITDYKTTSSYKVKIGDFSDWDSQGLIYAWMCYKNATAVKLIRFIAFIKDWSVGQAERDPLYPQSQIYVYEFEPSISEILETGREIERKIYEIENNLNTPDNLLPFPKDEELWKTPDKWAVWKNGGKRAIRVCDSEAEAKKVGGDYIEFREGVYNKLKYDKELQALFKLAKLI